MKLKLTTLAAALLSATLSASVSAELNLEKVEKIFSGANGTIDSHKEVIPGYYQVMVKPEGSIYSRVAYYTNENVDFITKQFVMVKPDTLELPTIDKAHDLRKTATFVVGEGVERFIFLDPTTREGLLGLEQVFTEKGFKNYVNVHFNENDDVNYQLVVPFYNSSPESRVKVAKESITFLKDILYGRVSAQQIKKEALARQKFFENNNPEPFKSADLLRTALEIADIEAKGASFKILDANGVDITPDAPKIKNHSQLIGTFDFGVYGETFFNELSKLQLTRSLGVKTTEFDFNAVDNFDKILDDLTVYKIGNGSREVLIFSDIDCPGCADLEKKIEAALAPDVTVRIAAFPIAQLHPNALDKHRHVLTVPEEQRLALVNRIRGTNNNGLESKEVIGKMSAEEVSNLDKKIEMSFTLGNLFQSLHSNHLSTPYVMSREGNKLTAYPELKGLGELLFKK